MFFGCLRCCNFLLLLTLAHGVISQPGEPNQSESEGRSGSSQSSTTDGLAKEDVGRYQYFLQRSQTYAQNGDWESALLFARYATELPVDTSYAWLMRAGYGFQLGNHAEAANSIAQIVNHYPQRIQLLDPRFLNFTLSSVYSNETLEQEYINIVKGLFDLNFRMNHVEPSHLWRNLAILYLNKGKTEAAARVVGRIDYPLVMAGILADRRFDSIVESMPQKIEMGKVAQDYVNKLSRLVDENPRSLDLIVRLTYAQIMVQDYEGVMSITDAVLEKLEKNNYLPETYDETDEYFIWILNNRAIALQAFGELEPAAETLLITSRMAENGSDNVSQVINLANMLCDLGKLELAANTLARVGDSLSDYGKMEVKYVEICLALQNDNLWAAMEALSYLESNSNDGDEVYMNALLATGKLDVVADAIVKWMEDPKTRQEALAFIQNYAELPITLPFTEMIKFNLYKVLNIPRVKAAVDKYGRINRYPIRRF